MSDADTIATLRAQLDSTLKDRALIIAAHDDARLAVARAVETAAEMAREGFMIVAPEAVGPREALASYRAQIDANIRALAAIRAGTEGGE